MFIDNGDSRSGIPVVRPAFERRPWFGRPGLKFFLAFPENWSIFHAAGDLIGPVRQCFRGMEL